MKNFKLISLFSFYCFLFFLLLFANNWILFTDDIYYDALSSRLSFERVEEMINLNKKWNWMIYPVAPLFYLLKFFLVSICLFASLFLFRVEVGLKSLFKIVLLAEFIFLLPPLIKLFWFSFINVNYTLDDLQFFSPLSAINLFDRTTLEPWLIYPLSLLNLFELGYIIALAYLMREAIESDFAQSLKLVLVSYGTGLFIWVLFITFLTVSLSA